MGESAYEGGVSGGMIRVYGAPHQSTSVKTHMPLSFVYAMPQLVKLLKGYGDMMAYGFASEADDGNLLS
jgi:hypothetical protein